MRPHPLPQRSPARRRGLGRSATSHITIVLLVGACIFCCIWSLFLSVVDWKDWKGDGGGLVSSRRSGDWAASKQRASRAELGRSTKAPDLRARPDKQSSWKTQLGLLFSEGGESSSKEAAQMNPKLQPIGLVCMGWRETTGCSPDNPLYRDGNRSCIARIPRNKAGYCELQDRRKSMRNAVQGDPPIRAMKISCTSQPPLWMLRSGIRCKDAWEFVVFAERSLAFRAPGSLQLASHSPSIAAEGVAGSPSRGIVMCVSDGTILSAYVSIRVLRDAGCSLPVELWHMPDELSKSTRIVASLVANYGAALRPALVSREELCHTGSDKCFNIKIHALFYAGFDQVLLLDSDNFAVRDPTFLFESGVFRATGAVFWPDYWAPGNSVFNIEPESLVWELTGLNFVKSFEQESGQVLVDRRRHAAALDVLMFYAQPNNALYRFKVVYGDKDLFRLAWMRAGQPFHMIEHPPAWAGEMKPTGFCGLTMVQYEPEGSSILFMHRNSYKLSSNATTHRRVWQAVVEFVAPDVGQYKAPLWIPGEAAGYVVGKEPCYGPANITDKYAALTNRSNDNTGLGTGESHVYDTISGLETMMMRHAQDGLSMLD